MNVLDFFIKIYSLEGNHGMPSKIMGFFRMLTRKIAYYYLPRYLNGKRKESNRKAKDLIVSFTSFPARIENVWWVVECMLRQSHLPSKIILWLSQDQFTDEKAIPESLRIRKNDVFEIRMVEGDIRSHKKYLYVSQEYPDSTVLLIDDDLLYPSDFIEKLLDVYNKTGQVVCAYGKIVKYYENGMIKPYAEWLPIFNHTNNSDIFFGSGGGVMFRPSCLYHDLTNIGLALKLTPTADDIWLNAMVRLANLKIEKIKNGLFLPVIANDDNETLNSVNNGQGANDIQLKAINDYYNMTIGKRVF